MRHLFSKIFNFLASIFFKFAPNWFLSYLRHISIKRLAVNHKTTRKPSNLLKNLCLKDILRYEKHCVVISHTNYLHNIGGTEKVIYEQSLLLEDKMIGTIQFFPIQNRGITGKLSPTKEYGINFDGQYIGIGTIPDILELINSLNTVELSIHHTLHWPHVDLVDIIKTAKKLSIHTSFYLHDFYTLCPTINMSCLNCQNECSIKIHNNDKKTHCLSKYTLSTIKLWRKSTLALLKSTDKVIAPSEFVKNIFMRSEFNIEEIEVVSPITIEAQITPTNTCPKKYRIAFLGYPSINKGWDVWENISENRRHLKSYEFFHIGSSNSSKNAKSYEVDFIKDGPQRVSELLWELNIDIVILWSTVPESFSFTYHEALAAGCCIITNPLSGNIQHCIKKLNNDKYIVLDNANSLAKYLLDWPIKNTSNAKEQPLKIKPNLPTHLNQL